ncbi:MAG: hypothetical protein ACI80S_000068 [Pseudohongiellaceae bacterium]
MTPVKLKNSHVFSGSYAPQDCEFLLQEIDIKPISVAEKERLLQKGSIHYSKMISNEEAPSKIYLDTFYNLIHIYGDRLAAEIKLLAIKIHSAKGASITVVSLARAGTPVGVLLTRALKANHTSDVKHYSVSIIRDRGIDNAALQYIADSGRKADSIIFVDGWTAKGIINRELKQAVADWNSTSHYKISDELCVISDLSGHAKYIATTDDYAIPSGVLNSTVSGLLSRTLMLDDIAGFHQCVRYSHLAVYDLSNWFVDNICDRFDKVPAAKDEVSLSDQSQRQTDVSSFIVKTMSDYNIQDVNKIKPGVAESTRVMLRRVPRLLILKDISSPDVAHLKVLANEKNIIIKEDPLMPFSAIAFIENVKE